MKPGERETLIVLQASARAGVISSAAARIIVAGDHVPHHVCRALVAQLLAGRGKRAGRKNRRQTRAAALVRWWELQDHVGPTDAKAILEREFPTLPNVESVMAKKPNSDLVRKAKKLQAENDDENFVAVEFADENS